MCGCVVTCHVAGINLFFILAFKYLMFIDILHYNDTWEQIYAEMNLYTFNMTSKLIFQFLLLKIKFELNCVFAAIELYLHLFYEHIAKI